jgi:hypothetical protein
MADEPDQRTELDDFLVILRKVQRPAPDREAVEKAEATSKHIQQMIRKGLASSAHHRVREQLEERLAQLRGQPHRG